ncbi:MAG: hypothetical protein ACR2JH_04355 [Solirubrobacteraceae bacterium]
MSAEPEYRARFEAFGVPLSVEVDSAELLSRVEANLPPGARPCASVPEENEFSLTTPDGVSYDVKYPGQSLAGSSDLEVALEVLDSRLRAIIALKAPEHIFVHAGAVARDGRAILIPGPTFSGKTSLVAEFVRAGMLYYSDEFAVLDREGLVHPYPKPLSLRTRGLSQTDHDVASLGGIAGSDPVPLGMIILARYAPGAPWHPQPLSPGEALLAMMANTVPAQERPEQSMATIRKAIVGAVAVESERGDAAQVVGQVLDGLAV